MAEIELPELPIPIGELPLIGGASPLGVVFPPTWIVIHNGHPSDKAVAEKIVDYLMTKMPPVFAMAREILPDADPDPMDLLAHGIIIVGGPACWWSGASHWHMKYFTAMDPGWENRGTKEEPIIWLVKKEPEPYEIKVTADNHAALISSVMGAFPWLSVFNVSGIHAEDTVEAGELFCEGKTRGIYINKELVADP